MFFPANPSVSNKHPWISDERRCKIDEMIQRAQKIEVLKGIMQKPTSEKIFRFRSSYERFCFYSSFFLIGWSMGSIFFAPNNFLSHLYYYHTKKKLLTQDREPYHPVDTNCALLERSIVPEALKHFMLPFVIMIAVRAVWLHRITQREKDESKNLFYGDFYGNLEGYLDKFPDAKELRCPISQQYMTNPCHVEELQRDGTWKVITIQPYERRYLEEWLASSESKRIPLIELVFDPPKHRIVEDKPTARILDNIVNEILSSLEQAERQEAKMGH